LAEDVDVQETRAATFNISVPDPRQALRCELKTLSFCLFTLVFVAVALGHDYKPPDGYVPDSTTAIRVAEAVLVPIYGKKQIDSELPLNAELKDGVWTVTGTLHCPDRKGGDTGACDGGVALVRISKTDARILSMTHYK
jgi:hypothetical protein